MDSPKDTVNLLSSKQDQGRSDTLAPPTNQLASPPKGNAKYARIKSQSPVQPSRLGAASKMTIASKEYTGAQYLEDNPQAYLFEEEDTTFQINGAETKLKNGDLLDPGANLNFVRQVQTDTQIKDTTITPFDQSRYCQVLMNPRTRMSDKSYEIITVQHIKENIRPYDKHEKLERQMYLSGKNPDSKLSINYETNKTRLCDYCRQERPGKMFYQVDGDSQFEICMFCQNKSFTRRKIEQKTSRQRFYQDFYLQASHDQSHQKPEDMVSSIKQNDMQLDQHEQSTRVAGELTGVLSHHFANVVQAKEKADWTNTKGSVFQEHAIVGFWCQDEKGRFRCYRQFKIDQPLYMKKVNSEAKIDTLLHVGAQGQVYYFYYQQDMEVCYIEIDLERAMDKNPNNMNPDFDENPNELELLNRKCYRLPVKQIVQFEEVTQQFLQQLFDIEDERNLVCNTPPQLYATQSSSLLCFKCPFEIIMSTSSNKPPVYAFNKKKQQQSSLLFIDLDKPEKFCKIIYNARLLINMYQNQSNMPNIIGDDEPFKGLQLWFCSLDTISNVKWEELPDPHLTNFNIPHTALKTIDNFKLSNKMLDNQIESLDQDALNKKQTKSDEELLTKIREYWTNATEIQSRINRDQTRCTILFGQKDYFVFQLIPAVQQARRPGFTQTIPGQAKIVLEHPPADDCCFAMVEDDPDAAFIVCNMQKQEFNTNDDNPNNQNIFTLDFFDLDQQIQEEEDLQGLIEDNNNQNQGQLEMRQLRLVLSRGIKKYQTDQGYKFAPYQFMTFYLYQTQHQIDMEDGEYSCVNQLFFTDQNIQQQRLAFTYGSEGLYDDPSDVQFQKPQHMPDMQTQFKWPIMVHNNHLPMQNQLIITNVTQNVPQIRLDLGDYRFLNFVNTGAFVPFTDSSLMQTQIFFLVMTPNQDAIRLMYYSTFAWPIAKDNNKIPKKRASLNIVSGTVCDKSSPLFKDFLIQKVLSANLLHHKIPDRGEQVSITAQFQDKIQVFNLNQSGQEKLLCDKKTDKMVGLYMIQAPNNQLYYVKRMRRGDALMGVYQKGNEVFDQKILEYPTKILHIQLANTVQSTEFNHMLYLITNDGYFVEVVCKSNSDDNNIENQSFQIAKKVPLSGVDSLLSRLQLRQWQQLIVSPKMIVCHKECTSEEKVPWQPQGVTTYNLESSVVIDNEFLDFGADKLNQLYVNKDPKYKKYKIQEDCYVFNIRLIPCVNKILTVCCEKDFSYIMVRNAFDSREIKLYDKNASASLIERMRFVGDKIAVTMPGQTLFFSQYDMMIKKVEPYIISKQFENGCYKPQGQYSQMHDDYFVIKRQYEKNNKSITQSPVVKLDKKDGKLKIVRENASHLNFQSGKEKISKILKGNNLRLMNCQPGPVMSSMGTYTQVYYTYQQKQDLASKIIFSSLNAQKSIRMNVPKKQEKTFIYKVKQPAAIPSWFQSKNSELRMVPYCGQLGTEEHDVFYIIRREDWDDAGWRNTQICLTNDYLVVKHHTTIYFCKLTEIDNKNRLASQYIKNKVNADSLDEETSKYDYLNEKIVHDLCEVKMQFFDTSKLLNERMHERSFKIIALTHRQTQIADHMKRRPNLIQLMFREISLVWNLNSNTEVIEYMAPSQFASPNTFCQLGININVDDQNLKKMKDSLYVQENKECSLYIKPKIDSSHVTQLFRTFNMLSLWEINLHMKQLRNGDQPNQIDLEAVLVNIYGQTYFELMREYPMFFNVVKEAIQDLELKPYQGENRVQYDDVYIRRLKATLLSPILFQEQKIDSYVKVFNVQDDQQQNILVQHHDKRQTFIRHPEKLTLLQWALRDCDNDTRLLLESQLSFYLMSSEIHMKELIENFDDFMQTFQYTSKSITGFLDAAFRTTEMTEEIKSVKWYTGVNQIVFGSRTAHLSSDSILKKIEQNQEQKAHSKSLQGRLRRLKNWFSSEDDDQIIFTGVNVNVVRISWLSSKMDEFYFFMSGVSDLDIYDTKLVKVVLSAQKYSNQLTLKVFIPWIVYFLVNIYYMTTVAVKFDVLQGDGYFKLGWEMRLFMCFALFYFVGMEISQLCRTKQEYFKDIWNWNYVIIYILNMYIMAMHEFPSLSFSKRISSNMAAIQVMQIWLGLLYWLRLFTVFSRYIHLIVETLKDVVHFMVLFFIVLFCFSNGLYIVDKAVEGYDVDWSQYTNLPDMQPCKGSKGKVIDGAFNEPILDSVVNQYLLSLGEFAIDSFEGAPHSSMIWGMFIIATFMSNIVFLNMIIAIMGDTYNRVAADWQRSALVERTRIYADYMPRIRLSDKFKDQKFIYVVTPVEEEEEGEVTTAIGQVSDQMKKNYNKISQEYKNSFDLVRSYQLELQLTMNKNQTDVQEIKDTFSSEISYIKLSLAQLLDIEAIEAARN